jgi:hypothetical protein
MKSNSLLMEEDSDLAPDDNCAATPQGFWNYPSVNLIIATLERTQEIGIFRFLGASSAYILNLSDGSGRVRTTRFAHLSDRNDLDKRND